MLACMILKPFFSSRWLCVQDRPKLRILHVNHVTTDVSAVSCIQAMIFSPCFRSMPRLHYLGLHCSRRFFYINPGFGYYREVKIAWSKKILGLGKIRHTWRIINFIFQRISFQTHRWKEGSIQPFGQIPPVKWDTAKEEGSSPEVRFLLQHLVKPKYPTLGHNPKKTRKNTETCLAFIWDPT